MPLIEQVIKLAEIYGRYYYRRITPLLKKQVWRVNHKLVERIWHAEGLKMPQKQPKQGDFLAQRWFDYSLATGTPQLRLEQYFCDGSHRRWETVPHTQYDRRAHSGLVPEGHRDGVTI